MWMGHKGREEWGGGGGGGGAENVRRDGGTLACDGCQCVCIGASGIEQCVYVLFAIILI